MDHVHRVVCNWSYFTACCLPVDTIVLHIVIRSYYALVSLCLSLSLPAAVSYVNTRVGISHVHRVPKNTTPSSYWSLWQFSTDFQNSFTGTLSGKFAIKQQRPHHTQNVSLHYLVKYKLSKIARTEARQPKTERAWTNENVIKCLRDAC